MTRRSASIQSSLPPLSGHCFAELISCLDGNLEKEVSDGTRAPSAFLRASKCGESDWTDSVTQAIRDLNSPLIGGGVGNTAPTDREVADGWAAASGHVCQGTSRGAVGRSKMTSDSVRPGGAPRHLGKTSLMPVQCGTEADTAARIVGKHALPISPCRVWFALFRLCQPGRA